jgi:hypothetical protein
MSDDKKFVIFVYYLFFCNIARHGTGIMFGRIDRRRTPIIFRSGTVKSMCTAYNVRSNKKKSSYLDCVILALIGSNHHFYLPLIFFYSIAGYIERSNKFVIDSSMDLNPYVFAIDMSKSNLCFKLCLLERGVQVTTYDFGFMDNSITN